MSDPYEFGGPFDYDFTDDDEPSGDVVYWPYAYCDGILWRFDEDADTFLAEWRVEE